MGSFDKAVLRFARAVFDRIEELLLWMGNGDDPLLQRALEADLGLPPGALDPGAVSSRPDLSGIGEYLDDVNPTHEKLLVTVEAIRATVRFWTAIADAARTKDPSIVAEEVLHRLLQVATVDLVKFRRPTLYAWLRVARVIEQDVRLALEEAFAPEVPAKLFTGEYLDVWRASFARTYLRFRLEQGGDLVDRPEQAPNAAERTRRRQLGVDVFGWSDAVLLGTQVLLLPALAGKLFRRLGVRVDRIYGWELPSRPLPGPCEPPPETAPVPVADHIASRGSTLRFSRTAGLAESAAAVVTQLFLVDADGRMRWLVALRGTVDFAGTVGSRQRPFTLSARVDAPEGLDIVVGVADGNTDVHGPSTVGGIRVTVEPEETVARGPALTLPRATGTRLEIGEPTFEIAVAADGSRVRGRARRSALVIAADDADAFVADVLRSRETRVDFDLGVTVDNRDGLYFDGGGRLTTTIAVNRTVAGVTVDAVQLALTDLLVAAAALSAAAALAKNAAKRKALEAAYKKILVEVAERGAEETAKRLMINGVKLGSKALEKAFREDLEKALVKDLEKRAAKQAAKLGARKLAGKVAAKAVPFLGVALVATDALAIADHVSKGGTIEFGLAAGEADLSGSTDVKTKGDQPESSATSEAKLTDTKVDIETTGIPDLSGTSEIDAKNVTITGSIKGDGTPVAVSFKVKLENSTIVIKHGGIIRGDKMVLSGDVSIKDAQIEIDLPKGASAASPNTPIVIPGGKLKITTTAGGGRASGASPESATPPTSDPKKAEPPATGLSEPVRARLDAAGPGVRDLIDAMVVPAQGRPGLRKDDATVGAILDKLKNRKVTAAELAELRKKIEGPSTTLDDLLKGLDANIEGIRARKATAPTGDAGPGKPATDKPEPDPSKLDAPKPDQSIGTAPTADPASPKPTTTGQAVPPPKPVDPNHPKFKKVPNDNVRITISGAPAKGAEISGVSAWGRLHDGRVFEATVTVKVLKDVKNSPSGTAAVYEIIASSPLRTETGDEAISLKGKVLRSL